MILQSLTVLQKIIFCGCFILMIGCSSKMDYSKAEQYVKESEKQWAESVASGDTSVIQRILADDFIGVDPDGNQYKKQQMVDDTRSAPKYFLSNHLNNVIIRFYGNTAVAQGDETWVRRSGDPSTARFVWTDTWVYRNNRWQIVAAEDLVAPVTASSPAGFNNSSKEKLSGIDSCRKKYVSAWLAADAGQITNVYADDAIVLYPNQPAIAGRSSILSYFKNFFKQFRQENFELMSDEVEIIGSLAYDRGKYKWKGNPVSGGNTVDDYGKYLVILQQQADGSWKVLRDMDNSDRPLSQATRE
jgi:uncharacterized protein (TIGR02246 family)